MKKILAMLSGLNQYKDLMYELVSRDIKVRYRRSILGLLWTLLNPILMMIILTIVFSKMFRFDIDNYPIYYFTGNTLFAFMSETTTNALNSIVNGGGLLRKVYVPKYVFPVSKVLAGVVNLFFTVVAMILVMLFMRIRFHRTILLMPIIIVYIIVFCIGLGLILATLEVFFRDTAHLYGVVTLAWLYLTPIFYPESMLPPQMHLVMVLNPMHHYIEYMRDIVLYGLVPSLAENLECLCISVAALILGIIVFYRKQDKFILYI